MSPPPPIGGPMYPTRHSIQRFQQRVAPATTAEAARRIRELCAGAAVLRRPRRWTPTCAGPGVTFLYPAALPGACLVVRDGVVLTVYERTTARSWVRAAEPTDRRRPATVHPYRRPSPGSL